MSDKICKELCQFNNKNKETVQLKNGHFSKRTSKWPTDTLKNVQSPTLNQCFILPPGKFKGSAYPRLYHWFATEVQFEPRKLDTSCLWPQKTLLLPVPPPGD